MRASWPNVRLLSLGLTALILFVFYKEQDIECAGFGTPDSHRPGRGCFPAVGDPFRGGYCHVQPLLCGGEEG